MASSPDRSAFPSRRAANWLIALVLTVHVGLGVDAARRQSVTHDEYWHLPAGVAAWQAGRFDVDRLNPPLTRMWGALPVAFSASLGEPLPAEIGLAELGDWFLEHNHERYFSYYILARCLNLAWSVATGWLVAVWARELFGNLAACLAAALWSFCPTALAHAALLTPDLGSTCLFTAALYASWKYGCHPSGRRAAVSGILLGAAQLAKFTSIVLFPLALLCVWAGRRETVRSDAAATAPGPSRTDLLRHGALAALLCLLIWNAGYLFHGSGAPLSAYRFQSQALQTLDELPALVRSLPLPVPRDYLLGLDQQRRMMEHTHPVFLDGSWNVTGYFEYFPLTLAYKLPHAAQALLALSVLFNLRHGRERVSWPVQAALWAPVVVLLTVSSTTGMQLGVRYLLPVFPFLHLLAAQTARWCDWTRFPLRTLLVGAATVALPWSLRHHPHHIAYFNEAAGGPVQGRRRLLDSNLDWGQDLRALKAYLDEQGIGQIGLAYFGMVPPAAVGIDYEIPVFPLRPGWYAVSVNFEAGRPHTIRNPDGSIRPAGFDEFGGFRRLVPAGRIGYSIDLFHVTEQDQSSRREDPPADEPRGLHVN